MLSKKWVYSGLVFGLSAILLTAVYGQLPKPQCLTQSDVAQSIERSRDGIARSCTEAIRLLQVEQQHLMDDRLAQLQQQRQILWQQVSPAASPAKVN